MNQLLGVIMCGGQSKRMGTDKGLIPIQNTFWSALMADKLRDLNLPVRISINAFQVVQYSDVFAHDELIVDAQDIEGPLNGLMSVHQQFQDNDLLLLACDMINMQKQTLDTLILTYLSKPDYNYYVYQNQKFAEPFCGIYTAMALKTLAESQLTLSGLSFQKLLDSGTTLRLEITEPLSFKNHNTN